jgi:hypothetical protein
LGLDVHYRQVTVAMQEDGGRIKAAGKMSHEVFLNWVQKKSEEGWQIFSCYEAGASGYWLHRELVKMGVKNLVVVPKAMGQGGKKQKTDRRDSAELCDALDRYLRGQRKALSVVGVPSVEQEEKRALIRYHRQIMADRGRCEARGKGLLCAQGIEVHGRWWQLKSWLELKNDPRLKDWMKEQLIGWCNKILSAEEEQRNFDSSRPSIERVHGPRKFCVPGVADSLDLPPRIEAVGLGHLFGSRWELLRLGGCCKDQCQHRESQKTDHIGAT